MSYVILTGAAGGIGTATSTYLAKQGYNLILVDIQSPNELALKLMEHGVNVLAFGVDITNEEQVKEFVDAIKQDYKISGLVHLAGITRDRTLLKMSTEEWDAVINVNLRGSFLICKHVAGLMTENGGSIVLTGSTSALYGNFGQANYVASKAGVEGLMKTMARELARYQIRVNCIIPGFIKTAMTDAIPEHQKERISAQIPMRRLGQPDDVAPVIEFLLSSKSSYITGTSIRIDGGLRI